MINNRRKALEQFRDFLNVIHVELDYLSKLEQIEMNRDWSMPNKMDSASLKQYKQVVEGIFLNIIISLSCS